MAFSLNDKHIIVNYHYVEDPRADFAGIYPCSVAEFERQVKFLSENYKIVSVPEVYEAAKSKSQEKVCAVTFDDGLRDQLQYAVPILKKYGVTATFFIITGTFAGLIPSAHRIHIALSRAKADELIDVFNNFLTSSYPELKDQYYIPKDFRITERWKYDDLFNANFKKTLTVISSEIRDAFLIKVFKDLKIDDTEINKMLFMNKEEIVNLARDGFCIESHTRSHAFLENASADLVTGDLKSASLELRNLIGQEPTVLSYPHGGFSEGIRDSIISAGFKYAVTTEPRGIEAVDDPLLIPRYDTNDLKNYLNK